MPVREYTPVQPDEQAAALAQTLSGAVDALSGAVDDDADDETIDPLSRQSTVASDTTVASAPPNSPREAQLFESAEYFADQRVRFESREELVERGAELERDRLLLARSLRKKHDSRAHTTTPGRSSENESSEHAPSPVWFESAPYTWIQDRNGPMHTLVLSILVIAPFIQLGGPVMELVNRCAHHNEQAPERTVRMIFAFGVFMFCATWPVWFRNLASVVHVKNSAEGDGSSNSEPRTTTSANEFMYDYGSLKQMHSGSGPLQQLRRERKPDEQRVTNDDPLGILHRWLTKKDHARIESLRRKMLFLSVVMLSGVVYITTVFLEVQLYGFSHAPEVADTVLDFFIPKQGCITKGTESVYLWLLIGVWCVAAAATSLVMPAWLLSLQLASTLAADAVDDVMIHVGQLVYWRKHPGTKPLCISPEAADSDDGWDSNVQIPVAMLVATMQQLSAWGPAMAMTVTGCWTCALCAVPTLVATQNRFVMCSTVLLFLVPFLVALAPANVSSSCDDLLEQLNDLSLLGDKDHKQRVDSLYRSMSNLNRGQGLGFKLMGTVVDRRTLVRVGMGLSAGTGLLTKLAAMGSGLDASDLHHANATVAN